MSESIFMGMTMEGMLLADQVEAGGGGAVSGEEIIYTE